MLVIYHKAANETIVKLAETKSHLPRTIYGTQNDNRTVIIALCLLMTRQFQYQKISIISYGFGGIRDRFDLVMPLAQLGDGGVFDHFRLK